MGLQQTEEMVQVVRRSYFISKPFDQVVAKLNSTINKNSAGKGMGILNHIDSKDSFENAVNSSLGEHGFMQFAVIDHGAWLKLYTEANTKAVRVVFGNPLIAITMLKHDTSAGLFVPIEALITEVGTNETMVMQMVPSSLIASHTSATEELKKAAVELDKKVEGLWNFVASASG